MKAKKNLRCSIGILAALCFVASLFVPTSAMAETQQNQVLSSNKWANEYGWKYGWNWADTSKSGLTKLSDGRYERVEWVSDSLYVEHYSDSYRFLDSAKIPASTYTPTGATEVLWGGYFAGSQFNFVVTGQSNENDSDNVAVMRVTKYSKNWNYLGNVEYYAINTYEPFDAGSLRMTEMNGELWIRTCHAMYGAEIHHQANMTFRIRESDLSKLDSETGIWNFDASPMGYASHSFNQFIVSTGSKIYSADHGDAYPRAIVAKDITPDGSERAYHFIDFKGQTGDNYTGSTLNGFETAGNGAFLLAAGTITDQDKAYSSDNHGAKNVWIGVAPTDGSQASIKYLTNFEFNGSTTATDPVLVKINENRFLVLWSTTVTNNYDSTHGPVQYVFIDGRGNTVSPVYSMNGALSDCQPIVAGDNVVWYVTGGSDNWWSSASAEAPTFYTINTENGQFASYDAAQTYTVSFDANGGSAVASQSVRYGSKATQPTDPTRTGHTFQGWYTARSGGSKYDFNQTVTGDVTLYARWVKEPAALRRLSGATRYDTMEKIVGTGGWKSGGTVIVASGGNYPDALAASGLAGVLDAPIVLTDGSALSVQASARLTGLAPSRIIVVGGRAAVSDGVVAALRGICPDVERVAGETRVDTSLDLYRKGSGWGSTAILATSGNFADALSVSSYAYAAKAPVFLVDPGTGLTQAQKAALRTFKQVLVVGGENAVPSRHVAGLPGVTRLSGATRYETSERIAEWATGHGLGMDGVVYATGANFPDALAAGPLAGGAGAVTLLVEDAHSPAISFSAGYKGKVNRAYVVGGVNAVSQNTADAIADSLGLKHAQ